MPVVLSVFCFSAECKGVICITAVGLSSGLCPPAVRRRGRVKHGRHGRNTANSRHEGDGIKRGPIAQGPGT